MNPVSFTHGLLRNLLLYYPLPKIGSEQGLIQPYLGLILDGGGAGVGI